MTEKLHIFFFHNFNCRLIAASYFLPNFSGESKLRFYIYIFLKINDKGDIGY